MSYFFPRLALACGLFIASVVNAAKAPPPVVHLTVLSAGGIMGAMQAIAPEYEKATGVKLVLEAAPPRGQAAEAIPARLARQEPADVVLLAGATLDKLVYQGQVEKTSRVDLGKSFIAMAVRQGAPHPDIGSMEAFRQTLLDAQSLAYSDSSSGIYLSHLLFPRMKLQAQLKDKSLTVPEGPVGEVIARGEAQLGFQQLSELKPVQGIDIIGLIPDQAQQMTLYSAAVVSRSGYPQEAQALLDYLLTAPAQKAIEQSGLKPVKHPHG